MDAKASISCACVLWADPKSLPLILCNSSRVWKPPLKGAKFRVWYSCSFSPAVSLSDTRFFSTLLQYPPPLDVQIVLEELNVALNYFWYCGRRDPSPLLNFLPIDSPWMKWRRGDCSEDSSCSMDAACGLAKVWWDFVDTSPGGMRNGEGVCSICSFSSMLDMGFIVESALSSVT